MTRALPGLLLSIACGACGGTWDPGQGSGAVGSSAPTAAPVPVVHQETVKSEAPDGGTSPSQPDAGPGVKPDATPPKLAPDAMPPDSSPPPAPKPPPVGGPCPCAAGQICFSGACRNSCSAPTGSCGATSTCSASEACLHLEGTSTWVCLPAVAPGAACGKSFCPNGHVCGSVNGSSYHCLPTCEAGKACAKGSCLPASASCSFCTTY